MIIHRLFGGASSESGFYLKKKRAAQKSG